MPNPLSFSSSFGNTLSFGNCFWAPCVVARTVGVVHTHVKPLCRTVDLVSRCVGFNATDLVEEFCIFKTISKCGSYSLEDKADSRILNFWNRNRYVLTHAEAF